MFGRLQKLAKDHKAFGSGAFKRPCPDPINLASKTTTAPSPSPSPSAGSSDVEEDLIFEIGDGDDLLEPLHEIFPGTGSLPPSPSSTRQTLEEKLSPPECKSPAEGLIVATLVVERSAGCPAVEWAYPSSANPVGLPKLSAELEADELFDFPTLDPWAALTISHGPPSASDLKRARSTGSLARTARLAALLALPAVADDAPPSTVFFVLPSEIGLLYGISCCSATDTKVSGAAGAVCVLSRCPFFGLLEQKLRPVTDAFFAQKSFKCTSILSSFHSQLDSHPFMQLSEDDLFHGLSHADLLMELGHELLSLMKAILLEARVLVRGPDAATASRTVLILVSLLPGGLWLSFNSKGLEVHHFHLQRYGLPLQLFGPSLPVYPYLGPQFASAINDVSGFLVGTSSRESLEIDYDVVLDLPPCLSQKPTVHYRNKELKALTRCSKADRAWLDTSLSKLEHASPKVRFSRSKSADFEPTSPSPAWVSAALRPFRTASNPQMAQAPSSRCNSGIFPGEEAEAAAVLLLHEAEWAAVIDGSRRVFWQYWEQLIGAVALSAGPCRDLSEACGIGQHSPTSRAGGVVAEDNGLKEARDGMSPFGLAFAQHWGVETRNGRKCLQSHRLSIPQRRVRPPRKGPGAYHFKNGDLYTGQFHKGLRHGNGSYVGLEGKLHFDGEWRSDKRSGNGTLTLGESYGDVFYSYVGEWVADLRHGVGSSACRGAEKYSGQWYENLYHGKGTLAEADGSLYEGEWKAGKFHGAGKHSCAVETYTGEFFDGQRHGMGQLVKTSIASSVADVAARSYGVLGEFQMYAGQWRGGVREGDGKALYAHGQYEGEWSGDKRHGNGVLVAEGYQLEGPWSFDEPDDTAVQMLFLPDGSKYTGSVRRHAQFADPSRVIEMMICIDDDDDELIPALACGSPPPRRSPMRQSDSSSPAKKRGQSPRLVRFGSRLLENSPKASTPSSCWWVVPEGRGIFKYPDGRFYDGEVSCGFPHGLGAEVSADSSRFEGTFFRGARHGSGVLSISGGASPSRRVRYEYGKPLPEPDLTRAPEADPSPICSDENLGPCSSSARLGRVEGKLPAPEADGSPSCPDENPGSCASPVGLGHVEGDDLPRSSSAGAEPLVFGGGESTSPDRAFDAWWDSLTQQDATAEVANASN